MIFIVSLKLANPLLARASGRQQEMAVRLALGGASRGRMVRQMLTEFHAAVAHRQCCGNIKSDGLDIDRIPHIYVSTYQDSSKRLSVVLRLVHCSDS